MAACVMSGCLRSASKIVEIGAFTEDNYTASPALSCVVLNVESGSTLFRMILFALSLQNECDGNALLLSESFSPLKRAMSALTTPCTRPSHLLI